MAQRKFNLGANRGSPTCALLLVPSGTLSSTPLQSRQHLFLLKIPHYSQGRRSQAFYIVLEDCAMLFLYLRVSEATN